MSLSFVGLGDLHFDKMKKLFPDTHHELVAKEVNKVCQFARDNAIKTIIQYGDVCESPQLSKDSRMLLYRLLKENDDLEWYFILGNHDWGEEGIHSLDELCLQIELGYYKHVHVITESSVVEIEGVPIHFMPYPVREVKKNHVNIAHVEINGFKSDSGRNIETEDSFPDDQLLLTGHLHTPQSKDPWYCVGTMYQTNFGETKDKGFHHVKVKKAKSGRLVWEVDHIQNTPEFLLENIVIEKRSDFKQLKYDPSILYKLFIKQDVEVPEDLLTKFPNICKVMGFKSQVELRQVMTDMLVIEDGEETLYKPTEYLGQFLKTKGATEKQVQRAMDLIISKGF